MKRVHVLVEGQTEETFVRDVLAPYLQELRVYLTPILLTTKRVKSGLKFKGGISSYRKVKDDLWRLLGDRGADAVTTIFDYYGLPEDFPGWSTLPRRASCHHRAAHLESALQSDIDHPRLLPYLSLHEFEALLFVSPEEVQQAFPDSRVAEPLSSLVHAVASPEEIDDGPETHPAARLRNLLPAYRKTFHGPLIVRRIGLAALRQRCPHFDSWIAALERLGETA